MVSFEHSQTIRLPQLRRENLKLGHYPWSAGSSGAGNAEPHNEFNASMESLLPVPLHEFKQELIGVCCGGYLIPTMGNLRPLIVR
jgi:hypothetical protein